MGWKRNRRRRRGEPRRSRSERQTALLRRAAHRSAGGHPNDMLDEHGEGGAGKYRSASTKLFHTVTEIDLLKWRTGRAKFAGASLRFEASATRP